MRNLITCLLAGAVLSLPTLALADAHDVANAEASQPAVSPKMLPGNGLAQHDFLYCGEYDFTHDQQILHLIRGGREVWSYSIPFHILLDNWADGQEFGDCSLLSNGNVLLTTRFGAREVQPDKTVVWEYQATRQHTEIHSIQPIGDDRVLMTVNGDPARLMIIDTRKNTIEKTIVLPTGKPSYEHGQFRRVRMTKAGNFLAAQMDLNKVVEYDSSGLAIWSVDAPEPWSAVRLDNGHTLIGGNEYGYVREVDASGKTVWELTRADLPGYLIGHVQEVIRLPNGNTVFTNWIAGHTKPEDWAKTAQIIEVTPDKKVVWALRSWDNPGLGPASALQILK